MEILKVDVISLIYIPLEVSHVLFDLEKEVFCEIDVKGHVIHQILANA